VSIIGIDTQKATRVAVAIDTQGTRLAALSALLHGGIAKLLVADAKLRRW
jgi:hypothetical protein